MGVFNQVKNTLEEMSVSLLRSTIMRNLHGCKYRVYSKAETTGYTQEQESQIRLFQKTSENLWTDETKMNL